jgi:Periplasmic binding protein
MRSAPPWNAPPRRPSLRPVERWPAAPNSHSARPTYLSSLLTAGSSPATIFGLSTVGGDTITAVKQAAEFGLTQNDRKIVVFLMFLPEVHAIGLAAAHGLYITDGF